MATILGQPGTDQLILSGANGASFNSDVLDRGPLAGPIGLLVDSTAGTTITLNIQGSNDPLGVTWFNVEYSLVATPSTKAVAAITITTTVISHYLISGGYGYRYLRCAFSANTGMTINRVIASVHG